MATTPISPTMWYQVADTAAKDEQQISPPYETFDALTTTSNII